MSLSLSLSVGQEPQFPIQVPGLASRQPDLVFRDWGRGQDLFVDVVGTSPLAASYRGAFDSASYRGALLGGAASRASAGKRGHIGDVLVCQGASWVWWITQRCAGATEAPAGFG
jgi:hypothetical protein